VDNSGDLWLAARRICWGKFMNAGQTCIAPDYVLVTPDAEAGLLKHLGEVLREMFGEDPQHSKDYGRMINERHWHRVTALLTGCEVCHALFHALCHARFPLAHTSCR
jgi:aldehyde dehydrogenase (NAD+)